MLVEEIAQFIYYRIAYDIYKVARKMLDDSKSKINLNSCYEDIKKVKDICNWLEENKNRKVTGNQRYVLVIFIAENIQCYGKVTDELSVNDLFFKILHSS